MPGARGNAHDRIDRTIARRHDETAGHADQEREHDQHHVIEPVRQQQPGQGEGADAGENVEIEHDAAPVLALGEDTGSGQQKRHRRGQGGLGEAQSLRAFHQGEGDDAGKYRRLQAESEKPPRHRMR